MNFVKFLFLTCGVLVFSETRAKSVFSLKKVCQSLPQITDIVSHPDPSNFGFFVSHKTGELGFCDSKKLEMNLVHKFDVVTPSEMGLLSVAFSPDFLTSRKFFIHRNIAKAKKNISQISEWNFSIQKASLISPLLNRIVFEIEQPYSNHNGGPLLFLPNGKLLLGLGDGGAANDPHDFSQNPNSLFGKILEFDVSASSPVPTLFATGLRNPWKMTIESGETLLVADVGQNQFEEISRVKRGGNYGWNIKEGFSCFKKNPRCSEKKFEDPIFIYDHSKGQSITGGHVATSSEYKTLVNRYVFGDFESGRLWALNPTQPQDFIEVLKTDFSISTFGKTRDGKILVANFYSGEIFSLEEIQSSRTK